MGLRTSSVLTTLIVIGLASPVFATQTLDADIVFNTPGFKGAIDLTIENKLVDLINMATPGSTIRMAQYSFDRPATALALNAASHRGVDVRLVLDGSNSFHKNLPGNATAIVLHGTADSTALSCRDGSCVKFCKGPVGVKLGHRYFGGSCNGLVINHNKFFLFSRLSSGDENVVAQSSENLSENQMHMYNDLIIIKNDRGFFEGMTSYWDSLFEDHTRFKHFPSAMGDGPVRARFFPRLLGRDPVKDLLERVTCQIPGSIVRVAAADFTRAGVADRLRALSNAGCDVKAITRFDPQLFSPSAAVGDRLGPLLMVLPYRGKSLATQSINSIHTKLMLVHASIDGSKLKIPYVLTGSHNLDFFSLRTNDETLLEIQDQKVFDTYLQFWNRIDSDARTSGITLVFPKEKSKK
jgi:hypothetical protein